MVEILRNARKAFGKIYRSFVPYPPPDKHKEELNFWLKEYLREGGRFENGWYKKLMLAIAGEQDEQFVAGKVIADFGCGPRGSLQWASAAKERIGIDVLADVYARSFDLSSHGMRYVTCTEYEIPLPDAYIDCIFTINAMDHVDDFPRMCSELLRVLKPKGEFIGSFNLHEPPTPCEPQSLDEDIIRKHLLDYMTVISLRTAPRGPVGDRYAHFRDNKPLLGKEEGFLWVRASKN